VRCDQVRWIPAVIIIVAASWMSVALIASDRSAWPLLLAGVLASVAAVLITRDITGARQELVGLPQAALRRQFARRVQASRTQRRVVPA